MNDILNKAIRSALFFMSALLALWAFVPEGRTVAAGLLLGTAASVLNALLLRRRVELVGKKAAEEGKRIGLGFLSRLAVVLLAVMTSVRFPGQFSTPATLAACFYVQAAVFFVGIVSNVIGRKG